jgi:hypothetical protein
MEEGGFGAVYTQEFPSATVAMPKLSP